MTTLDRLACALELLDQERRHLDKAPFDGDPGQVEATAHIVVAVRALLDEVGDGLAPHVRHLNPVHQAVVTGGWTFYDPDKATTWPPSHRRLVIRAYEADGPRTGALVATRRGMYSGGRLTWRTPGWRPLQGAPDGNPVPHGYHYSWREA